MWDDFDIDILEDKPVEKKPAKVATTKGTNSSFNDRFNKSDNTNNDKLNTSSLKDNINTDKSKTDIK